MIKRFLKYIEEKHGRFMIKQVFKNFEKLKEYDMKAGWYKELYRLHKDDEIMVEFAKAKHAYYSELAKLHLKFMTKWYKQFIDYTKKTVTRRSQ